MKERQVVGGRCMDHMGLPMDAILDKLDNKVDAAYAGWPTRLYLVGRDSKIAYAGGPGPFEYRPDEIEAAIRTELGISQQ